MRGKIFGRFTTTKNHYLNVFVFYFYSRVILSYLTTAYAKDDALYPKDIRIRAMVDQRLQFDLGVLSRRMLDYFVFIYLFF